MFNQYMEPGVKNTVSYRGCPGKECGGDLALLWQIPLIYLWILVGTPWVSVFWLSKRSLSKWARSKGGQGDKLANPGWQCHSGKCEQNVQIREQCELRGTLKPESPGDFQKYHLCVSFYTQVKKNWTWEVCVLPKGSWLQLGTCFLV